MPYIITIRPCAEPPNENVAVRAEILSRSAVATLEEAREAAREALPATANLSNIYACEDISAEGGTVGPLSDETVIEVERVTFGDLRRIGEINGRRVVTNGDIMAALNAVQ